MSKHELAWKVLELYAMDEFTQPTAEEALKEHLGDHFTKSVWETAMKRLIEFEGDGDGDAALQLVADLCSSANAPALLMGNESSPESGSMPAPSELVSLESDLMEQVANLRGRKRISAAGMPSIDDLLDPPEERYVEDHQFGGDEDIIARVRHEAVERGDIIEIDDSDDEDDMPDMGTADVLKLCQTLERVCLLKGDPSQSMELTRALRLFRGHVQRDELLNARQMMLAEAWGAKSSA
ncbi:hypothetical protein B0H10DRAFT_2214648 [Mycena sp. CBHHK59/15]|nr:hypothetical protein B0H10DRAFT_2214648 [Mycena sp. CBHHK59/15]